MKKVMLAVLCSMGLAFTSCQSDNVLTETNQSSVRSGKDTPKEGRKFTLVRDEIIDTETRKANRLNLDHPVTDFHHSKPLLPSMCITTMEAKRAIIISARRHPTSRLSSTDGTIFTCARILIWQVRASGMLNLYTDIIRKPTTTICSRLNRLSKATNKRPISDIFILPCK